MSAFSSKWGFPVACQLSGDMELRVKLACRRVHDSELYSPDKIYLRNNDAWPGDFAGRTLLAWHKYSSILQKNDPELEKALSLYNDFCNRRGFLGAIHPEDMFDEQQLSGHGWLLRAMAEIYTKTACGICRTVAVNVFENLALPLAKHLATYPLSDSVRNASGAVDGTADRRIGVWRVSTDVGAIFIFFAGLVHAAEVFELPAEKLLEQFVSLAGKVDFVQNKYQTHASLTLCRALLRYSRVFNRPEAGKLAEKIFGLYCDNGMTLNGANYNWFCRPEWTEPCAVVDGFMVAMELFRRSGKSDYLALAHKIWFSAIERAQRPNGGFGGDNCLRPEEPELYMKFYEAVNCCNMRAAEGFYTAVMQGIYWQDNVLHIALPIPGTFEFADGLVVKVETTYPYGDIWNAEIIAHGSKIPEKICCFMSGCSWMEKSGERAEFELEKHFLSDQKSFIYQRGPLMYGQDASGAMQPVNNLCYMTDEEVGNYKLQMIFEK